MQVLLDELIKSFLTCRWTNPTHIKLKHTKLKIWPFTHSNECPSPWDAAQKSLMSLRWPLPYPPFKYKQEAPYQSFHVLFFFFFIVDIKISCPCRKWGALLGTAHSWKWVPPGQRRQMLAASVWARWGEVTLLASGLWCLTKSQSPVLILKVLLPKLDRWCSTLSLLEEQ